MQVPNISKIRFLVSSNADFQMKNVCIIPVTETETQNYLAACDLVISKAGYSTLAEAITAKVPICLFKREGFKEDELMESEIKKMGIGTVISTASLLSGDWIKELDNLPKYKSQYDFIGEPYCKDGTAEIIDAIAELVDT